MIFRRSPPPGVGADESEKPELAEVTTPDRRHRVKRGKPVEKQGRQSIRSTGGDPPAIAGLHLGSVRSGRDNFQATNTSRSCELR
jgi:hypothetical protein